MYGIIIYRTKMSKQLWSFIRLLEYYLVWCEHGYNQGINPVDNKIIKKLMSGYVPFADFRYNYCQYIESIVTYERICNFYKHIFATYRDYPLLDLLCMLGTLRIYGNDEIEGRACIWTIEGNRDEWNTYVNSFWAKEPPYVRLFAIIVLVCDDYLNVEDEASNTLSLTGVTDTTSVVGGATPIGSPLRRFFRITSQLPMELQMIVAARIFKSNRTTIPDDLDKVFSSLLG
jgi:hypothetical protein